MAKIHFLWGVCKYVGGTICSWFHVHCHVNFNACGTLSGYCKLYVTCLGHIMVGVGCHQAMLAVTMDNSSMRWLIAKPCSSNSGKLSNSHNNNHMVTIYVVYASFVFACVCVFACVFVCMRACTRVRTIVCTHTYTHLCLSVFTIVSSYYVHFGPNHNWPLSLIECYF